MTEQPNANPVDDGVRHYTFLCVTALGAITLALFLRGLDALALLPALAGGLALAFRLRFGPALLVGCIVWLLAAQRWPILHPAFVTQELAWMFGDAWPGQTYPRYIRPPRPEAAMDFGLADLLLCAGTLVYVAGHLRLLSITLHVFPLDPRRRGKRDMASERRSPGLVNGRELLVLLAPLPIWTGLAWLCWRWLERRETQLDINDASWQVVVLAWLLGLVFLAASALFHYGASGQVRPEEATQFLQDTLWRETSREQRRINRWIAWARNRRRRREQP